MGVLNKVVNTIRNVFGSGKSSTPDNTSARLAELRKLMQQEQIDFYLAPSIDAHNSEYVPECWQRRTWISNFTGSAGEALIGLNDALLSTDGRYFLQADQELNAKYFTLLKQQGFVPETELWLKKNAQGKTLGIDAKLVGIARFNQLNNLMTSLGGKLIKLPENLIDKARANLNEQLQLPNAPALTLDIKYTGQSTKDKLTWLRGEIKALGTDFIALNALDEIAWLFNIRGNDIDFNPYVISYVLVSSDKAVLYADNNKFTADMIVELVKSGITVKPYDEFYADAGKIETSILLDDKVASQWMLDAISANVHKVFAPSPIVLKKSRKNPTEISGMRKAHVKDAVAVVNFFHWLENNWKDGVDEISASDKLEAFRREQENIYGLSFSTISGFASNGAIIHYRASESSKKVIDDSTLYLIDSGGQYLDGTTDITRTLHLGNPTAIQKQHYTLVLKGHLALARAKFIEGTKGEHLDALARMPLWEHGLNYRHGTGHGVGCFLGVHEGPQKISQAPSTVSLQQGMVVSNEPGLYLDGQYGIRIENLLLINKIDVKSEYGEFFEFEDLTLVPYCNKLIDESLLSSEDKAQLNNYYAQIRQQILPLLSGEVHSWLDKELKKF
jgi:Xaa-Pro aminopeptidase